MATTTPKQPYGITIPIQHGQGGYFNQSYSVLEQIKSNLLNLIQTKKGERRMNPRFGSDLNNVIFEFENEQLASIVESTLRRDINTWMPIIQIESINVDIRNELRDIYKVNVSILFTVPSIGINNIQTVDMSIDKQSL